jgi:hypothetical protein
VCYLAFIIIRGFSTSSKVFSCFVITLTMGAIFLGRYGGAIVNGIEDRSVTQDHEQIVIDKYTTTHKNSTTYHVVVKAWAPHKDNWSLTVGSSSYRQIKIGSTHFRIKTKKGKLGFEWVVSEKMMPKQEMDPISAWNWPSRDYKNWYPLTQEGIASEEMEFWSKWSATIEEGITNRMNIQDALGTHRISSVYEDILREFIRRQEEVLAKLSVLSVPSRLQIFQDYVLEAGHKQIEFYKEYTKAKIDNPESPFDKNNDQLKVSDQRLWDAYHNFQALYPSRSKAFNDAIEQRLCWFDII